MRMIILLIAVGVFCMCGLPHLATVEAIAQSVTGTVDDFEDHDVSDWAPFTGSGATISRNSVASDTPATGDNYNMKVTYTIPAGSYAGLEKLFNAKPNWSTASGLRIRVNIPQGHRVHVQIY